MTDEGNTPKFLATIQFWVDAADAVEAENIAVHVADYAAESNENPDAEPNSIQTCIVEKAPFRPLLAQPFWTGSSVEGDNGR